MMDYAIRELDAMTLVQSEGTSREKTLAPLKAYLDDQSIEPEKFLFVELYNEDGIAGAMSMAQVNQKPESNAKFRVKTLKEAPYLIVDMSYDEFKAFSDPAAETTLDITNHITEEGYKIANIPFFEFIGDNDETMVRVYIMLK